MAVGTLRTSRMQAVHNSQPHSAANSGAKIAAPLVRRSSHQLQGWQRNGGSAGGIGLRRASAPRAAATSELPLPEGSLGLPLVGETLELLVAGDTFGTSRRARYGDVWKTNILGAPTVMVYGEAAVRAVLAGEDKLVATDWPQVTPTLVGPSSLNLLTGTRHGAVKRALAEAFSEREVMRYVPRLAEIAEEYLDRWCAQPQPFGAFAGCQELSQALFDVAVMGGDGDPQAARVIQDLMATTGKGFQTPPVDLPFTDYGRAVAARHKLGEQIAGAMALLRASGGSAVAPRYRHVLNACARGQQAQQQLNSSRYRPYPPEPATHAAPAEGPIATITPEDQKDARRLESKAKQVAAAAEVLQSGFPSGPGTASCALAAVMASQPQQQEAPGSGTSSSPSALPDDVIIDNIVAAYFGNASTGPTLAKALQYVAANPAVLQQLRDEQQAIVSRRGSGLTAEALGDMEYGSCVAREVLRITPAVPAVFRVALTDFELGGRLVPKQKGDWRRRLLRRRQSHKRPGLCVLRVKGWRVWCHLGDSVLKYNQDTFAPERWTQQQQLGSSPAEAAEGAAASSSEVSTSSSSTSGCPVAGLRAALGPGSAAQPEYSSPFGWGVRMCLGRNLVMAELLVIVALLARHYDWAPQDPQEAWGVVPTPAPKAGLQVTLRRHDSIQP